jgi:hypothetical protein
VARLGGADEAWIFSDEAGGRGGYDWAKEGAGGAGATFFRGAVVLSEAKLKSKRDPSSRKTLCRDDNVNRSNEQRQRQRQQRSKRNRDSNGNNEANAAATTKEMQRQHLPG